MIDRWAAHFEHHQFDKPSDEQGETARPNQGHAGKREPNRVQGPPHEAMAHENQADHRQTADAEKDEIFGIIHVKRGLVRLLDRIGCILEIIARAAGNLGHIEIERALVIAQFQRQKNTRHKTHDKRDVNRAHQLAAVVRDALGQLAHLRRGRQEQALGIARDQIGKSERHMRGRGNRGIAEKRRHVIPRNPRDRRVGHARVRQNFRHPNIAEHACHQ